MNTPAPIELKDLDSRLFEIVTQHPLFKNKSEVTIIKSTPLPEWLKVVK